MPRCSNELGGYEPSYATHLGTLTRFKLTETGRKIRPLAPFNVFCLGIQSHKITFAGYHIHRHRYGWLLKEKND